MPPALAANTVTQSAQAPHIQVRDLTMEYGDFVVQQNLNFNIVHGDIFVIMGDSGCGKSTLMKHMIGLMRPASGCVYLNNTDYWSLSETEQNVMKSQYGVMFQGGALWSSRTLAENIALPLQNYTKLNTKQINELVELKLALVGLRGFETFYPAQISGGMRKRAALARAMALDPKILFFDEPSAGLDPINARRLDDLIIELSESFGTTIVVVTHELSSIFAIGRNAVFLDSQEKTQLAIGEPKALRDHCDHPKVRAFLSRSVL